MYTRITVKDQSQRLKKVDRKSESRKPGVAALPLHMNIIDIDEVKRFDMLKSEHIRILFITSIKKNPDFLSQSRDSVADADAADCCKISHGICNRHYSALSTCRTKLHEVKSKRADR